MTDITQDRERIRAYLASLPAWKCQKLDDNSKVLFDTCTVLLAMVDGMSHKLDELDFLHHEGGPQSVAAMEEARRELCDRVESLEAENARLRDALLAIEWNATQNAHTDTGRIARAALRDMDA